MTFDFRFSGTSPSMILRAMPSAMAVFADAGLAHENRVVLRAPRKDLQHAADLLVTPDDRVGFFPKRACSLRLMAYLPSASNCCSEVCESTVAPLRKVRIASISSFSVAPLRLRMSAACPRSATRASSRCSTEAYLSPKFFVKSTARWIAFGVLRKELLAAALDARQRRHGPADLVAQRTYSDAHASQQERRKRIVLADQRREQVETVRQPAVPRSRASESAACPSCALMVRVLMFIVMLIYCFCSSFCRIPFPNAVIAASRRVTSLTHPKPRLGGV